MKSQAAGDADGGAPVWRQIRAVLAGDIASGQYPPGARLPSEAALARRFAVNRHTLRRALAELRQAGLIDVRRGAGAVVTAAPIDYRLGTRTRFEANLAEAGQAGTRRILRLETLPADDAQAAALGLAPGAPVHLYEAVGLGDGVPLTFTRSVFPAGAFPDLARHLAEAGSSVTRALAASGLADYRRASTRLAAQAAEPTIARHLRVAPGHPLLRAAGLNVDGAGRAVEHGLTWFCTDRVELVVDPGRFGERTDPGGAS